MLGEDGARAVLAAVQWRRRQMAVGPSGCPEPGSQRATHGDDWRVFLGCGSTVGFGMVQAKDGLGAGTAEPDGPDREVGGEGLVLPFMGSGCAGSCCNGIAAAGQESGCHGWDQNARTLDFSMRRGRASGQGRWTRHGKEGPGERR